MSGSDIHAPTGATGRNRPPRGAFLIPRPLAEEPHFAGMRCEILDGGTPVVTSCHDAPVSRSPAHDSRPGAIEIERPREGGGK